MNQSINTDSKNSKEPQQKYRLGTVSIKILGGLKPVLQAPYCKKKETVIALYSAVIAKRKKHFLIYPIVLNMVFQFKEIPF